MTSLRKAQHGLLDAGPAAHARPQQQQVFERPHHLCQAPGCFACSERGFPGGRWFCFAHKAMGETM